MDKNKVIYFVESSFLKPLLECEDITDISYNGNLIYYVSNINGRKKSNIDVSNQLVKDFVRQIANLCEKQFSFSEPILDVNFGKYRFNAVHNSIGRFENEEALTFSLRIASFTPKINDNSTFLNKELVSLFDVLIKSKVSILVAGSTGSGKTEFQKYLIRKIKDNTRIIVIDNVSELECTRNDNIDLTFWRADNRNNYTTIPFLIKNALRSNPDWLIVAEARGGEMEDVLNSAMTGIPIISTIHAFDVETMPSRAASMVMMQNKRSNKSEILNDLQYHIRFYVYIEKTSDNKGNIKRFIKSVGELNETGKVNIIYDINSKPKFKKISKTSLKLLKYSSNNALFVETFVEKNQ